MTVATRRVGLFIALVVVTHGLATKPAAADMLAFPAFLITYQDKLDWLAAEADRVAQAIEIEAERPLPQQHAALYRDMLARGTDLLRLLETVPGRSPGLKGRVGTAMTEARAGLERLANGSLRIGMSTEDVRAIRGEPSHISRTATATGVRQDWDYGMTRLSFDDDSLVAIVIIPARD